MAKFMSYQKKWEREKKEIQRKSEKLERERKKQILRIKKWKEKKKLIPLLNLIFPGNDCSIVIKREAIEAIGAIGDSSVLEPLLVMLESKDEGIQLETLAALKNIGDKRAIEPIVRLLDDQSTKGAKEVADFKYDDFDKYWKKERTKERTEIRKKRIELCFEAASTLVAFGHVQITEPLLMLCIGMENPPLDKIAKLLERSLGDLAVDQLIDAYRKDISRTKAIEILSIIGNKRAQSFFHEVLNGEISFLRDYALEAIYKMEGKQAFSTVIKSIKNANNYTCETAVKILGKIADERAVDPLIELVDNLEDDYRLDRRKKREERAKYPSIKFSKRFAIYDALTEIGGERVTNYFVSLLGTCFEKEAAIRLAKLQDKRVVRPLVGLLCKEEDELMYVFEIFSGDNRQLAIDELINSLGYKHQRNRYRIIYTLGRIGDERAADALKNCEIYSLQDSLSRDSALIDLGKEPLRYDADW